MNHWIYNWKKNLLMVVNILLAVYLFFAITSFNQPVDGNELVCSQVKIDIKDAVVDGFLNANEIKSILQKAKLYPLAQPMDKIDARKIEDVLKSSPFVNDAQCYKTQMGHVCIQLTQRTPVMRVKAENGDDYYVDNHGGVMPNSKYCSEIMIATGKVSRQYACKVLTKLGNTFVNDKFWRYQIVQVNVLADGTVELVPRVGEHIIYIGYPNRLTEKLARLEKFYRYGLSEAGWNKYSYINLAFENQIICKKKQNNISI